MGRRGVSSAGCKAGSGSRGPGMQGCKGVKVKGCRLCSGTGVGT